MSGRQLADRLGVKPPRITELEKAEVTGNISLNSLRKAAEALDCVLVYALVPKSDLDSTLRRQAEKAADRNLQGVSHTMHLEAQGVTGKESAEQSKAKAEEWVRNPPRWLWDIR